MSEVPMHRLPLGSGVATSHQRADERYRPRSLASVCAITAQTPTAPAARRGPAHSREHPRVLCQAPLQGYLAHKRKPPPPIRTIVGP